jgi:hypothetical protein
MACPSTECRAGRSAQRSLMVAEQLELPLEQWVFRAQICSRCGCVYSVDTSGEVRIRGFHDGLLLGRGWKPAESKVQVG